MRTFETYGQLSRALRKAPLSPGAFRFAPQFAPAQFRCTHCHELRPLQTNGGGTGYAIAKRNRMVCYSCCGQRDSAEMVKTGRATLYLSHPAEHSLARITNWPGTLDIRPVYMRTGRHNMAGKRYDTRFIGPDGKWWHGVTYGDNTQIHHCRRLRGSDAS